MGVEHEAALAALEPVRVLEVGLQDEDRPWRLAARRGVDQDQRVVPLQQLVREVDAADAEVRHLDAGRKRLVRQAVRHLDTEAVVAEEDIADAGHQHAAAHGCDSIGSTSSGAK